MRPRQLGGLAAVVLALAAFIFFVERDLLSSDERRRQAKDVLTGSASDVVQLDIFRAEGLARLVRDEVELEGEPTSSPGPSGEDQAAPIVERNWRLAEPVSAQADVDAVEALLAELFSLQRERTLRDFDPVQLGLESPRFRLSVEMEGGRRQELTVGADLPASDRLVVSTGAGAAYVVNGGFLERLDRTAQQWRAMELFPGSRFEIASIRLAAAGERLEFRRRGPAEEYWVRYGAGTEDRADADAMAELLEDLAGLTVAAFLDDPGSPAAARGLEPPEVVVEAEMRRGRGPFRLELGSAVAESAKAEEPDSAGKADYFGRLGDMEFEVRTDLPELARRPLDAWRSRELTTFEVFRVETVVVEDGRSAPFELHRREGRWWLGERSVDYDAVSELLYSLTDLRGELRDGEGSSGAEGARDGEQLWVFTLGAAEGQEETLTFTLQGQGGVLARSSARSTALQVEASQTEPLEAHLERIRSAEVSEAETAATSNR